MKVFIAYLEPPGRGSGVEASAEYLAEDRSMTDISRLLESDGLPPPLDMHAYTATLRLGLRVAHVLPRTDHASRAVMASPGIDLTG